MPQAYFSKATFRFQRDLAANNNRAWFAANKRATKTCCASRSCA